MDKKIPISKDGKNHEYNIETMLSVGGLQVVLLMNDGEVLENNVVALDEQGNLVWSIESILSFKYPEAYVALSKKDEHTISVISYSGVCFEIDVFEKAVVGKRITK